MFKRRPAEDVQGKWEYYNYYAPRVGLIAKTIGNEGYEEVHSKIFLYEYCLH